MADFEGRLDELFERASALPAEQREAFIDAECADDEQLRAQLREMLFAEDQLPDSFLPHHTRTDGSRSRVNEGNGSLGDGDAPEQIGKYRIVRELGRGGMGVVYEAEQENPRRRVALKIIRQGLGSAQLSRRFRQEAHVLGHLRHSGIAQIYEAGTERIGGAELPYFAMELIDGAPLDQFAKSLSIRERVELMARVCDAVQHAHQRGIIHRDLKPANIHVVQQDTSTTASAGGTSTIIDGIGQPKIMDFGIARLTDADIQVTTIETNVGQIVGTFGYMSPEQIEGNSSAIDTRCDVYALGVILYQLLAGEMPHDLGGKPIAEAARIVREVEPRRLSATNSALRGDLDTIVTKAIEKDPARRYSSAAALGEDLRRHLASEPILAHPPSTFYQLRKFAGRNRALVGGVAATFVALVAGLIGTVIQMREAKAQRDEAIVARQQVERVLDFQSSLIRDIDVEAMGLQMMSDMRDAILADDEATSDPAERDKQWAALTWSVNPTNLARQTVDASILARAADGLDKSFEDDPRLEATLRQAVGDNYAALGAIEPAERHTRRALELRRRVFGDQARPVLESQHKLGDRLAALGDFEAAESTLLATIETQKGILGAEHADTARSIVSLGALYNTVRRDEDAEAAQREALAILRETVGGDDRETIQCMYSLGESLRAQGRLDEARQVFDDAIAALRSRRDDVPELYHLLHSMGVLVQSQGQLQDAQPYFEEAYEGFRRLSGDEHPTTLNVLSNVAALHNYMGEYQRAYEISLEILEISKRVFGPRHPDTLYAMEQVAYQLSNLDRLEESLELAREAFEGTRAVWGDDHPRTLDAQMQVCSGLVRLERLEEARPICQDFSERADRVDDGRHALARTGHFAMADLLFRMQELDGSERHFLAGIDRHRRELGVEHPETGRIVGYYAVFLERTGRAAEAEPYLREVEQASRRRAAVAPMELAYALEKLGLNLLRQERDSEAEAAFRECLALRESEDGDHWTTHKARGLLGEALSKQERFDQAEPLLIQSQRSMHVNMDAIPAWMRDRELKGADDRLARHRRRVAE